MVPETVFQSAGLPVPRSLEYGVLLSHVRGDKIEAQAISRTVVDEYDKNTPKTAPSYASGRVASRLFSLWLYDGDFHGEGVLQNADLYAQAAIANGSTDPLILSIRDQALYQDAFSNTVPNLNAHLDRARAMAASSYPPLAKVAAVRSAIEDLRMARDSGIVPAKESPALIAETAKLAGEQIAALTRKASPKVAREQAIKLTKAGAGDVAILDVLIPELDQTLQQAQLTPEQLALFQGQALVERAWTARGPGWATSVSDKNWEEMSRYLAEAQGILTKAAEKYPNQPLFPATMISVERGQGEGIRRMQEYFDQAMKLDRNSSEAYEQKLDYLEPLWYGDPVLLWSFGQQSAATKRYDAKIPLAFTDGLRSMGELSSAVYKNDEAWEAAKTIYEGYLTKYPESVKYRTQYLDFAVKSGHWKTAAEQLNILGAHWDRSTLSAEEYDAIQKEVAIRAQGSPSKPKK